MFVNLKILLILLWCIHPGASAKSANDSVSSGRTQVVILGSGNPNPDPHQSGCSIAIIVNDVPYIVDFGPGLVRKAAALSPRYGGPVTGLTTKNLKHAFLTHLHSDHTAGYPDLILTPWVMGRDEPFIAIRVGLAGGAEDVLFPDSEYSISQMCDDIREGRKKGKVSWIIVVSEGAAKADDVAKKIKEDTGYEVRAITLGHVQRGGSPSAFDRVLASRLGAAAVDALIDGKTKGMVGVISNKLTFVDFKMACGPDKEKKELDKEIYGLTKILAI